MVPELITSGIGIDPSLRHGCVVYSRFRWFIGDNGSAHPELLSELISSKVIFEWNKQSSMSVGQDSTPEELMTLSTAIAQACDDMLTEASPMPFAAAVDFDNHSVYWRSNKLQAVTLGMLMGLLYRQLLEKGLPVIFVNPSSLRAKLGLKPKTDKEAVWNAIQNLFYIEPTARQELVKGKEGDRIDAFILSYLVNMSKAKSALRSMTVED